MVSSSSDSFNIEKVDWSRKYDSIMQEDQLINMKLVYAASKPTDSMLLLCHVLTTRVKIDWLVLTTIAQPALIYYFLYCLSSLFQSSESVCTNPYHRERSWMASTQMPWYTGKSWAIQKMSGILQVLRVKETHALLTHSLRLYHCKASVWNLPS